MSHLSKTGSGLSLQEFLDPGVITLRLVCAPQGPQRQAAVVIDMPVIGINGEGLIVGFDSSAEVFQIGKGETKIVIGVAIGTLQPQRPAIIGNGACWLAETTVGNATIVIGHGIIGRQGKGLCVIVQSQVKAPLVKIGIASQEIGASILGMRRQVGGEMLNDLLQVLRIADVTQVRIVSPVHLVPPVSYVVQIGTVRCRYPLLEVPARSCSSFSFSFFTSPSYDSWLTILLNWVR